MDKDWTKLRINEQRFWADFEALNEIGKVGDTGISRPALSPAHLAARDWLRGKIQQAGMAFRQDGAGNQIALLNCGPAGAASWILGSHLDSVPNGGRFDGALGVLAALEVLRTVLEAGMRLPFNLEAIDFTDEEGTLASFLGSFAFAGLLTSEDLTNPRGGRQALEAGLRSAGLSETGIFSARRDPKTAAGYLELHIEQGSRLAEAGKPVGIVTHISGIAFYRLTFHGRAEHAGTAPMGKRLDAGLGSSAFTLSLRRLILEQFPDCFANVGAIHYEPGLFNIVPEKAVLSLEFRAAETGQFQRLTAAVLELAAQKAKNYSLQLDIQFLGKRDPVETSPAVQNAILQAGDLLGLKTMPLISRAGHDAQAVAALCPVGMIFVPSVGGISHSPDEFTPWQDCVNGANVLLQAILRIAGTS
jgi:hydantoinase/carbamoylase family amidase